MLKIADLLKIVSLKDSLHPDSLRFLNCFLIQSPQTFVNYFLKTKADVCIYRDISTFGDLWQKCRIITFSKKTFFRNSVIFRFVQKSYLSCTLTKSVRNDKRTTKVE